MRDQSPAPPLRLSRQMRAQPAPLPSDTARTLEALLPDLRRVGRRLTRNWGDADDLVQDTLLRVWSRLTDPAAEPVEDLRAYAFAVLRNRALRRPDPAEEAKDEPQSEPDAENRLACAEALAALDSLPPDQAEALRRRAIAGESYAEIAEATGVAVGTVTSRLARGRAALAALLGLSPGNAARDGSKPR
ncbi:sigma-70 family RNA polymerase sigma factor [Rhodobacterales bacterium HKCCE3408]|nr:sigma-70 family RNA polymerase sigma factor [Rhodobacterales bacterium HKCCE3408]